MYFDYFDLAFYINLDTRPERRELFEKRTQKLGFSIPRFQAITLDKNDTILTDKLKLDPRCHLKIGCSLSHIEIVKLAKKNKHNNVLIFEDDCVFDKDFISKINICVKELKNCHWDLFYMGGEPCAECLPLSENLRVCPPNGGMYGTHAYAVNHTFYDRILHFNPIQPGSIDILYLNQSNRTYVLTKELLVTQDDLESDLWGGIIRRTKQYQLTYNRYVK